MNREKRSFFTALPLSIIAGLTSIAGIAFFSINKIINYFRHLKDDEDKDADSSFFEGDQDTSWKTPQEIVDETSEETDCLNAEWEILSSDDLTSLKKI